MRHPARSMGNPKKKCSFDWFTAIRVTHFKNGNFPTGQIATLAGRWSLLVRLHVGANGNAAMARTLYTYYHVRATCTSYEYDVVGVWCLCTLLSTLKRQTPRTNKAKLVLA